jgi:predicted RNA-binding protein with PUA-like domain
MPLLQKGQRLSVQPVPQKYFDEICKIAEANQVYEWANQAPFETE